LCDDAYAVIVRSVPSGPRTTNWVLDSVTTWKLALIGWALKMRTMLDSSFMAWLRVGAKHATLMDGTHSTSVLPSMAVAMVLPKRRGHTAAMIGTRSCQLLRCMTWARR